MAKQSAHSRKYIHYKEGYKYQLHKTYEDQISIRPEADIKTQYITLTVNGGLSIRYGYAWDGPSGPTIDTPSSMRGSLIHDALYQLMRMGLLDRKWKSKVDLLFEKTLVEDDMWEWRARIWYRGVAELAEGATLAKNQKKVHIAPAIGRVKYLGA